MDNPARIIAIVLSDGELQPCIRIARAVDIADREQTTNYYLDMAFSFFANGEHVPSTYSSQTVVSTQFLEQLDEQWDRCRGNKVTLSKAPDKGSPIICAVRTATRDRAGNVVYFGTAETTSFTVT